MLLKNGEKFLFVFQHGWSCDGHFFDKLISALSYYKNCEFLVLDSGYYSSQSVTVNDVNLEKYKEYKIIAVGHSMGFFKLLSSHISFDIMISICGFVDFSKPKINLMIKNFQSTPQISLEVIKFFYYRCQLSELDFSNMQCQKLLDDLHLIANMNNQTNVLIAKLKQQPSLALCSKIDVIVNNNIAKHTDEAFFNYKVNHGLGALEVDWCVEKVVSFIEKYEF
jgi:hypothetical protein